MVVVGALRILVHELTSTTGIGQQFALTEASYVLVRLLQRFDQIEAAPGELEGETLSNVTLTSCPARPVTLRLREAKD